MVHLILASQSTRRKEILSYFNLPFKQVSPSFDEHSVIYKRDPIKYVSLIAEGKAKAVKDIGNHEAILAADTIVYRSGKVYHKPQTEQEAFSMLWDLAGKWHSVFTGVVLLYKANLYTGWEETRVLFNHLTKEDIYRYHQKIHWADKAGGYAIQRAGSLIVNKIDGCYYNVMGLPLNTLRSLLKNCEIDLLDYVP
ncbi:Maf-like protein [Neochlamydia sp. EPS4]|uniref:nucleoside triphosphate pyrophosphatase n=1 Tax=Neochlamydia sp. EPS4 TaxID=1478175 RepID=UPI000583F457|nr:nucleoside triphosphate pyrophosphatase [Neochlamydia sp. EPS4]KIC74289.1 Maf-like protein [Neochlamydia sp. EPS4]